MKLCHHRPLLSCCCHCIQSLSHYLSSVIRLFLHMCWASLENHFTISRELCALTGFWRGKKHDLNNKKNNNNNNNLLRSSLSIVRRSLCIRCLHKENKSSILYRQCRCMRFWIFSLFIRTTKTRAVSQARTIPSSCVRCSPRIATIGHRSTTFRDRKRPQVLLSGESHGDERIGPSAVMYAAQLVVWGGLCSRVGLRTVTLE